jgi:hypothetical protein
LYQLYKDPNIVKMAKAASWRWLGHLCKEVRKRGRPPVRWMDAMKQDLCTLGIRGWKNIALDRSRWPAIVKVVKAWNRLWYHGRIRSSWWCSWYSSYCKARATGNVCTVHAGIMVFVWKKSNGIARYT